MVHVRKICVSSAAAIVLAGRFRKPHCGCMLPSSSSSQKPSRPSAATLSTPVLSFWRQRTWSVWKAAISSSFPSSSIWTMRPSTCPRIKESLAGPHANAVTGPSDLNTSSASEPPDILNTDPSSQPAYMAPCPDVRQSTGLPQVVSVLSRLMVSFTMSATFQKWMVPSAVLLASKPSVSTRPVIGCPCWLRQSKAKVAVVRPHLQPTSLPSDLPATTSLCP
mmetsp:Transcript_40452/g.94588  ORF Transcript_40452/g.94588 Transcript_40452/m.94588 type:complete len:221 (-) Transcript_40452:462-1124(-)